MSFCVRPGGQGGEGKKDGEIPGIQRRWRGSRGETTWTRGAVHIRREITSRSANGVFADAVREKLYANYFSGARIRNRRGTFPTARSALLSNYRVYSPYEIVINIGSTVGCS